MLHNIITIALMVVIAIIGWSYSSDAIDERAVADNFENVFTLFGSVLMIEAIVFVLMNQWVLH